MIYSPEVKNLHLTNISFKTSWFQIKSSGFVIKLLGGNSVDLSSILRSEPASLCDPGLGVGHQGWLSSTHLLLIACTVQLRNCQWD